MNWLIPFSVLMVLLLSGPVIIIWTSKPRRRAIGAGGGTEAGAPTRPAVVAKPVSWMGLVIIIAIALAIIIPSVQGLYWLKVEDDRLATTRTGASRSWGEIKTLTIGAEPVSVPWEKGAVGYETHLAPGEDPSRRYWLESSDGKKTLMGEESGMPAPTLPWGKACRLWSADGRPLKIVFQRKFK